MNEQITIETETETVVEKTFTETVMSRIVGASQADAEVLDYDLGGEGE